MNPNITSETYIVRMRRLDAGEARWSGEVQNVRTGKAVSVYGLEDLLALFRSFFLPDSGADAKPETSHPQANLR